MLETLLIFAVIVAALAGLAMVAKGGRYEKMTEEEYEAEAKHSSRIGGALLEFQKAVDPSHKVEYVQMKEKHAEAERAGSGDGPQSGTSRSHGAKNS